MQLVESRVIEQRALTGGYRLLLLEGGPIAVAARPGQFVHLRVPGLADSALRRPFSIYRADRTDLALLYKGIGRGTERMASLAAGDVVSLIGPLGNGFPLGIGSNLPVLIAGGYGVAPLEFLARRLPSKGVVLIGGRTAGDILCTESLADLGWKVEVATQDGSLGHSGMVTDLLDAWIESNARLPVPVEPVFFSCGPDGLLRAVGKRAVAIGCKAWISLDKHMVCAVGACLACVQKLRNPDGTTRIGRVCYDGPIFEAREIVWGDEAA